MLAEASNIPIRPTLSHIFLEASLQTHADANIKKKVTQENLLLLQIFWSQIRFSAFARLPPPCWHCCSDLLKVMGRGVAILLLTCAGDHSHGPAPGLDELRAAEERMSAMAL